MAPILSRRAPLLASAASLAIAALALTGCAAGSQPGSTTSTEADHDHEDGHEHEHEATESSGPQPRLALTYDGGILVVDANSLEVIADLPIDGFNRLSPGGDNRNVFVSTTGGWAVLDAGTYTQPHGDHTHSYVSEPVLSDVVASAETPGHVVHHDGQTALFDDGTGEVTIFATATLEEQVDAGSITPTASYESADAHHGVAVPLADGQLFVTVGNESERNGAQVVDTDGNVIAESDECPGIHGETTVGDDLVLAGCEDGVLLSHGDHFHKIDAPDDFGRTGNAFADDDSTVVLGDYKTDPEGGIDLTQIALIDTVDESINVVDTGSHYTWHGLARGEDGEALVFGTDGTLRVFDPGSGELVNEIAVTDEWTVPDEWQTSHPAIVQDRGYVYISDPNTSTMYVVDYLGGEVTESAQLPHEVNELALASGQRAEA
ncbi:hypothetical protein [Gulosibacter sediminis]|uniref:hypothetical protein n=1 Tax=Gulosibacter sediminis TaxID=1729695 RepID=UPI001868BB2C|nr:hypothetical protein [Gulosibacter sediminis]